MHSDDCMHIMHALANSAGLTERKHTIEVHCEVFMHICLYLMYDASATAHEQKVLCRITRYCFQVARTQRRVQQLTTTSLKYLHCNSVQHKIVCINASTAVAQSVDNV
jgi:hypothetical protein